MGFLTIIIFIIFITFVCALCCGSSNNTKKGYSNVYTKNNNIQTIDAKFRVKGVDCPKCGYNVPSNSKFCPNCGFNLNAVISCPVCGTHVSAGSKYCSNCGAEI